MSNVCDRDIVVLAPEERRLAECAADAQHRAGDCLSLPLGHDPVFDPRRFSGNLLGISRDIAGCKNISCACTQHLVDHNPVIDFYAASSAREVRGETPTPSMTSSASTDPLRQSPPSFRIA